MQALLNSGWQEFMGWRLRLKGKERGTERGHSLLSPGLKMNWDAPTLQLSFSHYARLYPTGL